jgi:hypothetical protein
MGVVIHVSLTTTLVGGETLILIVFGDVNADTRILF